MRNFSFGVRVNLLMSSAFVHLCSIIGRGYSVNPTLLTLTRQRGEIDCGGQVYL